MMYLEKSEMISSEYLIMYNIVLKYIVEYIIDVLVSYTINYKFDIDKYFIQMLNLKNPFLFSTSIFQVHHIHQYIVRQKI